MNMEKHSVRDIPRRKFLELSMKGGLLIAATPALMTQLISCKTGGKPSSGIGNGQRDIGKNHFKSP